MKNQNSEIITKLTASKAHQWMSCPASVQFQAQNSESPLKSKNTEADRGTEIHAWAEAILGGLKSLADYRDDNSIEPEDYASLEFYIAALHLLAGDEADGIKPELRFKRIFLTSKPKALEIIAVCDAVYFKEAQLNICDLKTGWTDVTAEDNKQLLISALLAAEKFGLKNTEVIGRIIQPTQKKIDTTYIEIKDPELQLRQIVDEYHDYQTEFKTGEHCKYCSVNDVCPTLNLKLKEYLNPKFQDPSFILNRPNLWSEFLEHSRVLEKLAEKIRSESIKLLKIGGEVPGFELAGKNGPRSWSDKTLPAAKLAGLLDLTETDLQKIALQSPTQIEKIIKSRFSGDQRAQIEEKFRGLVGQPVIYYLKKK